MSATGRAEGLKVIIFEVKETIRCAKKYGEDYPGQIERAQEELDNLRRELGIPNY